MMRPTLISALVLTTLAGSVLGQGERKPLPPPPAEGSAAQGTERLANMAAFLEAYRRAGSPRLLIATDAVAHGGGGGAVDMGDTLGARLEDLFRDPEVIVINAGAQGLLGAQQREALRGNDEFAAARTLARDVGADMVLSVTMSEKSQRGCYSGSYVITDLRQGTTLGRYAFDMLPDERSGQFDSYRLSEYARAIARRMSTQFIEAFPAAGSGALRRYTLRIVGDYSEEDLSYLRDALNQSEGVRAGSVNLRGEERSSATVVTTMDMLSSQDLLGVRQALRTAINNELVMGSEVLDVKGQTIDLRLSPLGLTERERALAGGPATARNKAERDALAQAYEKAGRPTVAVMINRALVQESPGEAGVGAGQAAGGPLQQGDGTNIIIGERVGLGRADWIDPLTRTIVEQELKDRREERVEQREVDLRSVENRVVERLTSLGLALKDVAAAQAQMKQAGELAGHEWTDRELGATLGNKSGAQVVLSGVAKVTRSRPGAFPVRVELTMRAYRVSDGVILGASTTGREVASAGATLEQALDALSAEAVGRMAGQLADAWGK
ncbi:MAG: hypothetical protein U0637_02005 [Phycisphaerales bacterium]